MACIELRLPHHLHYDQAFDCIRGLSAELKTALETSFPKHVRNVRERWNDCAYHIDFCLDRMPISGTIVIGRKEFAISCDLPCELRWMKIDVDHEIRERIIIALEKCNQKIAQDAK